MAASAFNVTTLTGRNGYSTSAGITGDISDDGVAFW